MTQLFSEPISRAQGKRARLLALLQEGFGFVPNVYANLGTTSVVALEATLYLDELLRKSTLNGKDVEVIKLAISEVTGAEYSLAAHTFIARKLGLAADAIVALRQGTASGDNRLDALAWFVRQLVTTRGVVPPEVLRHLRGAGYTDRQVTDALVAIASIVLTSLFNRVNNTELDFPPPD